MNDENKGFLLTLSNERNHLTAEKRFLNPKKLYIPEIAAEEIALLVSELDGKEKINDAVLMVTMTNSNNGVSVDKRRGFRRGAGRPGKCSANRQRSD